MDIILQVLFSPLTMLIGKPWLALLPAAVFMILYWRFGYRLALFASISWIVAGLNEAAVAHYSPGTNIRVDLIVIAPLVVGLSFVALVAVFKGSAKRV
ncbi:MAG: hypothetical protein AAFU56_07335 [Pseudomonadota bacterium]